MLGVYFGNVLTTCTRSATLADVANEPSAVQLLWPDPESGPWEVTIYWRAQHGVPTPVGLDIKSWREWGGRLPRPTDDVAFPPVTGRLMRELPVGQLVEKTLDLWAQHLHPEWDPVHNPMEADTLDQFVALQPMWSEYVQQLEKEREAVDSNMRHGRDLGDDHYRRVAGIYATAVQAGERPTQKVADTLTISKSAAAKQVARARKRGFLPSTSRGRVGRLTEEL